MNQKHAILILHVLITLTFLTISLGPNSIPKAKAATWTEIWNDEFDGPTINPSHWLYDLGTSYPAGAANWGTGEVETMTNNIANVYQDGATPYGHLIIKPILNAGTWTSGRLETTNTFAAPLGGQLAVEASIQLPAVTGAAAQGYWPAFWMLGAAFRGVYTNWPSIGEIDAMENANGTNTVHGTFHCGVTPGGPCNEMAGLGGSTTCVPDCQGNLHTYRIEVDRSTSPEAIRWYLDGVQYWQVLSNNPAIDAATWANAVDHAFFIILNVAMGGSFPGALPSASTTSGVPMVVDYVRVYSSNGLGVMARSAPSSSSGSFTQGVVKSSSTTCLLWFKPSGRAADSVIVRYSFRPQGSWQTPNMVYNSSTARWEYMINGLPSGKSLRYRFMYTQSKRQLSTKWSWWSPGG